MYILEIQPLNDTVKTLYEEISHHHDGDSGIDLYFPEDVTVPAGPCVGPIPLGFRARMIREEERTTVADNGTSTLTEQENVSWLIMPRSSIVKTPFRMANSLGLIDAGYRGEVMVPLDNFGPQKRIKAGTRLVQAVAPALGTIKVKLVSELDSTTRGTNGFGSTGNT